MTEIMLPPGRVVQGHPMTRFAVKDKATNQQKEMKNGELQFSTHVALAIAKNGETHWNQTAWGKQLFDEGVKAWPTGEHATGAFSWKVTNGDSTEPNKKMNVPCEQEGFPGHWVIHINNLQPMPCYHGDQLSPHQQIQDEKEIKTGDYGQLLVDVKKNTANTSDGQTAGMFIEGKAFSLRQIGKRIIGKSEVDAEKAFAGQMGEMPTNMQIDEGMSSPPPAPGNTPPPAPGNTPPPAPGNTAVQQATDFTSPPPPAPARVKIADGSIHTVESLLQANWPQATVDALEKVV